MAVCDYCQQEMLRGRGCSTAPLVIRGRTYLPIRNGEERRFGWPPLKGRCHDCGVPAGEVHHHGCDAEECPACGHQSISCGCVWAGEEAEDDGWEDDDWAPGDSEAGTEAFSAVSEPRPIPPLG